MKNYFTLLALFLIVGALNFAQAQSKPRISFTKTEHNFGDMQEKDGRKTVTFEFSNTGSVPLTISMVSAAQPCVCVIPKWTKDPIAPGAKGTIDITYDPLNYPGAFSRDINVISNAETSTVALKIIGKVLERERTLAELYPSKIGDLRAKSSSVNFSTVKSTGSRTEELELVNDTDKPIEVGLRTVPDYISIDIEPKTVQPNGKAKMTVTFDGQKAGVYGYTSNRVYLTMNGNSDYNKNSFSVSASIEEDFSMLTPEQLANAPIATFNKMEHDFGDIKQGAKPEYSFELKNTGKSDLMIRSVKATCGCTAVEPEKKIIAPGETAPIKVTFNSTGQKGRNSKGVTVITNDPKGSNRMLRISSNVI
ncbi:MAG: DUF1573 domain-containing protein [Prolixibacteraceae bacterium]|nr:DUF1573 domain-containing protein [Prolixibacteraceae bacterium]